MCGVMKNDEGAGEMARGAQGATKTFTFLNKFKFVPCKCFMFYYSGRE